ncbi:hypothetical protein ACJX0J_007438, partial [Zea mays]
FMEQIGVNCKSDINQIQEPYKNIEAGMMDINSDVKGTPQIALKLNKIKTPSFPKVGHNCLTHVMQSIGHGEAYALARLNSTVSINLGEYERIFGTTLKNVLNDFHFFL